MGSPTVAVALLVGAGFSVAIFAVVAWSWRTRVRALERDVGAQRQRSERRDERLARREATLEARASTLELRERNLLDRERVISGEQAQLEDVLIAQRKRMEEIGDLTADQARQQLFARVEADSRHDLRTLVRDLEQRAHDDAEHRARDIVATAVQRVAVETTHLSATCVVQLDAEELKGRIIGRDGRNIRAFEHITGVNLVVDDTPNSVLLSCFDPVRREIGRETLAALVTDGRIHPASIEAQFRRARGRIQDQIRQAGREAAAEARVEGLSPELLHLLGQLCYRTSYGQNVLRHAVETAHLAGLMAAELDADPVLARRCGLLHDIGKALTHEVAGSHALIGAQVAARLGEPVPVCHAIQAHHGEVDPATAEAVLTRAADAISASRPGARRAAQEQFATRLQALEQLCATYEGVDKVYAMQAGRDLRVMVRPESIDDRGARALAQELRARIERELSFPGQIVVTVVRELRVSETAR